MRRNYRLLALGASVLLASAGTAGADITMPDHPNAKKSSCEAKFDSQEATCTITAIGKDFGVGISASDAIGVIRVVLEAPPSLPGLPPEQVSQCEVVAGFGGCVGGSAYVDAPYAYGTQLTCHAYGVGNGSFECASFETSEEDGA